MVGMADGFAQATGRPTHVNLHTAPGVGNAVGGIFNAQANKSPLVITAGQQVRLAHHDGGQPDQPRRDGRAAAVRQVGARAAARPGRARRAGPRHPPRDAAARGAGVRLDPDGRLGGRGRGGPHARTRSAGTSTAARCPTRRRSPSSPRCSRAHAHPVLVAGPDIDASGGWDAAVALAEKQRLPVWASPATGGNRLGFPEGHPNFVGVLPPAIGAISETLKGLRPRAGRRLLGVPLLPLPPGPAAA